MELEQYDRDLDLLRAKEEPSEEDLNRIEELQMSRYAAAKRLSDMERKMQNMQAHRQRKRNKTKRKIGRPTLESKNIRIAEVFLKILLILI